MDVSIHSFKMEDINGVLEIESLSFNDPWTKRMFEEEIKNGNFYVVKEGERLIGYGGFVIVMDEGNLVNLAIHPLYRRRGIGTRLLRFLMDRAKGKGVKKIFLEVRRKNIPAISFYLKNGFLKIGERKGYYNNGEDAIIMVCHL